MCLNNLSGHCARLGRRRTRVDDRILARIAHKIDRLRSQEQTQRQLLRDLLDRAFGGSVKELVLQALATKRSSPEELEAIEKLLDRFEGEKK